MATWLVSGASGQDGSYLSEQARELGHDVVGLCLPSRAPIMQAQGLRVAAWDFKDPSVIRDVLNDIRPERFFNLAAYSTGSGMFEDPVKVGDLNGLAVARMLEAIADVDPGIRFCQASSSEMYGDPIESPLREDSGFLPRSPYAAAKLFAHSVVGAFRDRQGLFACSAILFNHESPRRPPAFVTRKICDAVARIRAGLQQELQLQALDAQRDWGYAPDFVRAMRLMLEHGSPDDFVIATGELHSVRDLCEIAFSHAGLDWRDWVLCESLDPRKDARRARVGDPNRAREVLGWAPSIGFKDLVELMVDASIARISSIVGRE